MSECPGTFLAIHPISHKHKLVPGICQAYFHDLACCFPIDYYCSHSIELGCLFSVKFIQRRQYYRDAQNPATAIPTIGEVFPRPVPATREVPTPK